MNHFPIGFVMRLLLLPAIAFAFLGADSASAQNMRIENRWQRDYVHNQDGKPEVGAIRPNWASALWEIESAGNGKYLRFKSAYTGKYINNQTGELALSEAQKGWWSAMWQAEEAADGWFRYKNRWKGTYLYMDSDGTLKDGPIPHPKFLPAQWRLASIGDPINNLRLNALQQKCFNMIDGLVPTAANPRRFASAMEAFAASTWEEKGPSALFSKPRYLTLEEMQEFRDDWRKQNPSISRPDWSGNFQMREEAKRYCTGVGLKHDYEIPGLVYCLVRDKVNGQRDVCQLAVGDPRIEKAERAEVLSGSRKQRRLKLEALTTHRGPLLSNWTRPCEGSSQLKHMGSGSRIMLENKLDRPLYVTIVGTSTNRLTKATLPKSRYVVLAPRGFQTIDFKAPYSREYTYNYTNVLAFSDEAKASKNNTLNWLRQTLVGLKDFAQGQQSFVSNTLQKAVKEKLLDGREAPTPTLEKVINEGVVGIAGYCSGATYELWGSEAPLWVRDS